MSEASHEAPLRRTPLFDTHLAAGGQMVPFAGWEMPVQYKATGLEAEHRATRTAAGLFDVSHMGEIIIDGEGAKDEVNRLVSNDVRKLQDGEACYALLCHPHGGVVDDLFVYRLAHDRFLLVVNASNIDKDFAFLRAHASRPERVVNRSDDFAQIALQGPLAAQILAAVAPGGAIDAPRNQIHLHGFVGYDLLVATTGYTGEPGFEIYCAPKAAAGLWQALLDIGGPLGLVPVGLGARDTLRLEVGYALYGHELADDVDPFEGRVGWAVKLDGRSFVGSDALVAKKAAGPARRLVGLEMVERGIARADYAVLRDGAQVGHVTSGTHSPTLGKPVAMALVDAAHAKLGTELDVDLRGRLRKAVVVKLPFLQRP